MDFAILNYQASGQRTNQHISQNSGGTEPASHVVKESLHRREIRRKRPAITAEKCRHLQMPRLHILLYIRVSKESRLFTLPMVHLLIKKTKFHKRTDIT